MRRLNGVLAALLLLGISACAGVPAEPAEPPRPVVEGAWVRTTVGAKDPSMTAAFLTVVNPGETDLRLTSAEATVAHMVQLHEMVEVDGKLAMQEAKDGISVPAGGHTHLTPGGYHVMLMGLTGQLAVGDEVQLTLNFADGSQVPVTAPVKEFVEEEDHYHSPEPSTTSE